MANIRGSYQSGDQATVIVIPDNNTNSTRQQPELQTRKDLVDFGRTMKTTFKNLLFEDEGEKLLSRIADARPKVIPIAGDLASLTISMTQCENIRKFALTHF